MCFVVYSLGRVQCSSLCELICALSTLQAFFLAFISIISLTCCLGTDIDYLSLKSITNWASMDHQYIIRDQGATAREWDNSMHSLKCSRSHSPGTKVMILSLNDS